LRLPDSIPFAPAPSADHGLGGRTNRKQACISGGLVQPDGDPIEDRELWGGITFTGKP